MIWSIDKLYQQKIETITKLIQKGEYVKAIQALAITIEMINNKHIGDEEKILNLYEIMEHYRLSDEKRYEIMIDVNYLYEQVSNEEIELKQVVKELKQKCIALIKLEA